MRYTVVPVIVAVLFGIGCSDQVVYQSDQEVPGGAWLRSWRPAFEFDVADTVSTHDVYLDIRHTGDYPYSNLYTFISLKGPDGRVTTDTVECTLADAEGRWYGKGTGFIFSDRHQANVLYKYRERFPRKGRYAFTIEQAMRTDTLSGVIDVGVSVERSKGS